MSKLLLYWFYIDKVLCYNVVTFVTDAIRRALTAGLVETALRCVLAKMAAFAILKMATATVHQVNVEHSSFINH